MRRFLLLLAALGLLAGCTTRPAGGDDDDSANDDDSADDDDTTADDDDTGSDDDDTADDDDTGDDDDTATDDDDATPDDWTATEIMYAHTASELFSVDPEPPYTVTPVSTFFRSDGEPAPNITDLAVNLQGAMYGVSTNGLWRIAPVTGELEFVTETDDEFFVALTFLSSGTLLGGSNGDLLQIVVSPPALEVISAFPDGWEWDGDMVGLPDGLLYCAVKGVDDDEASLMIYDADDDSVVSVEPTGHTRLFGVGFGMGTLFGFTDGGDILSIDVDTGEATIVASPGHAFWGAATNPVRWGPVDPVPPG